MLPHPQGHAPGPSLPPYTPLGPTIPATLPPAISGQAPLAPTSSINPNSLVNVQTVPTHNPSNIIGIYLHTVAYILLTLTHTLLRPTLYYTYNTCSHRPHKNSKNEITNHYPKPCLRLPLGNLVLEALVDYRCVVSPQAVHGRTWTPRCCCLLLLHAAASEIAGTDTNDPGTEWTWVRIPRTGLQTEGGKARC